MMPQTTKILFGEYREYKKPFYEQGIQRTLTTPVLVIRGDIPKGVFDFLVLKTPDIFAPKEGKREAYVGFNVSSIDECRGLVKKLNLDLAQHYCRIDLQQQ